MSSSSSSGSCPWIAPFKGPRRYSVEAIIGKLREAEVALGQGATVEEVIRRLGISEPTYYCWRREYGGLQLDQAKRLKDLERENARWTHPTSP